MKPEVFTGNKGKHIITWIDQFESITVNLAKSALLSYNNLPEATKNNQELVKDVLRRQYHREDRQWRVRSDLYALTQTGTLTQYID